ncbi:MAG: TIGR03619 family F420-dependent LLM class oxidoreductase [Anaerolineae bacterium]|nr:TIGR03619 family F420-dependent LLM class oxidoreductase [Anaerolineae bacterium]
MTSTPVRYALYMPNFGVFGDVRRLADLAQDAEKYGWDGFFLWDHVAPYDEQTHAAEAAVDPWVALALIAATTQHIRLGTTVTPIPRRRPWKLARETVTLDRLSGGRLILGVGIGLGDGEWADLGEEPDSARRGAMLDEGLEVLTGLWSGKPFSYNGQHYEIKRAQFLPTPIQAPRIPIWVGGFWPNKGPFRRMARWDGMFPLFQVYGPEQTPLFKEAVAFVQEQRRAVGLTGPFDVVNVGVTPGDDPVEAAYRVSAAAAAGMTWWLELLMPELYGFGAAQVEASDVLRNRVRQGPPRMS